MNIAQFKSNDFIMPTMSPAQFKGTLVSHVKLVAVVIDGRVIQIDNYFIIHRHKNYAIAVQVSSYSGGQEKPSE